MWRKTCGKKQKRSFARFVLRTLGRPPYCDASHSLLTHVATLSVQKLKQPASILLPSISITVSHQLHRRSFSAPNPLLHTRLKLVFITHCAAPHAKRLPTPTFLATQLSQHFKLVVDTDLLIVQTKSRCFLLDENLCYGKQSSLYLLVLLFYLTPTTSPCTPAAFSPSQPSFLLQDTAFYFGHPSWSSVLKIKPPLRAPSSFSHFFLVQLRPVCQRHHSSLT